MKSLLFISRHAPTQAQRDLAARLGFDRLQASDETLTADAPNEVRALGIVAGEHVAVVAPLYVGLALIRSGYRVVEFVNDPAARAAGVFHCLGVYVHALQESTFLPAATSTPPQNRE